MTPDPHEKTILDEFSIPKISENIFFNSFLSLKVLFSVFIKSLKGKHWDLGIDPLFKLDLGSFSKPLNLALLLASINLNFCWLIFLLDMLYFFKIIIVKHKLFEIY